MALNDATATTGLCAFAAAAAPILDHLADAGEHLAHDHEPRSGMAALAGNRLAAARFPGAPAWPTMTAEDRAGWWTSRIWVVLSSPAAAPELLGATTDRFPVGAAVEVAARGLTVCATAREHGVIMPFDQVRLLARVLLHRDIAQPVGGVGTWSLPERPRSAREAITESMRLGRGLMALLDDVADELDGLTSPARSKGWGRLPGVAAVRAAKDLRSTLRADCRATASLLENSTTSPVGPVRQLERIERSV